MTYTTTGIILRDREWKDVDRLYTVYTKEYGKVTFIARGIRKGKSKLNAKLQKFRELNLYIAKGRLFDIIAGVNCSNNFSSIQNNLISISITSLATEIIDIMLKEAEQDEVIYKLFLDYLQLMEMVGVKQIQPDQNLQQLILCSFIMKLLSISGYHLEVKDCARCQSALSLQNLFLSFDNGGIVCNNCYVNSRHGSYITTEIRDFIAQSQDEAVSWDLIKTVKNISKLRQFVLMYVRYRAEYDIKSEKFLNIMLNHGLQY